MQTPGNPQKTKASKELQGGGIEHPQLAKSTT